MKSNVTQADLAHRLRLSTCTVSKILSRSLDGFTYSKVTIARVERMARQMGYRLNVHARSLRTRRSQLAGLILPSAQQLFFGALTEHLEMELRRQNYEALVAHSREDSRTELESARSLVARGVDGLLWAPVSSMLPLSRLDIKKDFPLVFIDRAVKVRGIPLVATDNQAACRTLALRLKEMGHRSILVLNAPRADQSMEERVAGLKTILGRGVKVMEVRNEVSAAHEAVLTLKAKRRAFTALVPLAESLSLGALAGLRDIGWTIPEDISFVAFDDFPLSAHWTPPITLIRQNISLLARQAVSVLLDRIRDPGQTILDRRVPAFLEWRHSVTPITSPSGGPIRVGQHGCSRV